jgi:hypothetical protein
MSPRQNATDDHPGTKAAEKSAAGAVVVTQAHRARYGTDGAPRHQQTIRGESRLWVDQVDDLTQLTRRLMADRTNKSERITSNTLLRVAVDFLLAHKDELQGDTEDELRQSVVPDPDFPEDTE